MATDYISLDAARKLAGVDDTIDDTMIGQAISAASRMIDDHCGRYFSQDGSVSARIYQWPDVEYGIARVDDISTTAGLIVKTDTDANGTYDTTWATTDYQLEPLNGVVGGLTGWPYTKIRAVGNYRFPSPTGLYAPVQVTAKWGWSAVPDAVEQACGVLTAWLFGLKGAPLGVAGFDQFGSIRVRENPAATMLLAPYVVQVTA